MDTQKYRETDWQTDGWADRHTDKWMDRLTVVEN